MVKVPAVLIVTKSYLTDWQISYELSVSGASDLPKGCALKGIGLIVGCQPTQTKVVIGQKGETQCVSRLHVRVGPLATRGRRSWGHGSRADGLPYLWCSDL
jgi:hypothetical protein